MAKETWRKRVGRWLGLATVTPVDVGLPNDGLVLRGGTLIDKPWGELFQEFEDAREAWRKNPLARRLIGLITSYVVGNGITLGSDKAHVQRFLKEFWQRNRMDLRVDEMCDELSRSGELFPVLFTNPVSGMSTLRLIPASMIDWVDYDLEDYEREIRYREVSYGAVEVKWWMGVGSAEAQDSEVPLMLHYAVNRPVGAVRGESDLAPILPWLKRYNRWLEDRVRLNAAMRAFLWIVKVPARLRSAVQERYLTPPEAGSVIIAEEGAESWEAIAPNLHASDAEKDGRAIRWMIVAGGPGTALIDIGEGEDANQATGTTMAEMRRRFLRRRQAYLVWLLLDLTFHAYKRWQMVGNNKLRAEMSDFTAVTPDISPEDNQALASAASSLSSALQSMANLIGSGPTYRGMALRLFAKFAGENISGAEAEKMLAEGEAERERQERKMMEPRPAGDGWGAQEQEEDEPKEEE